MADIIAHSRQVCNLNQHLRTPFDAVVCDTCEAVNYNACRPTTAPNVHRIVRHARLRSPSETTSRSHACTTVSVVFVVMLLTLSVFAAMVAMEIEHMRTAILITHNQRLCSPRTMCERGAPWRTGLKRVTSADER